MTTRVFINGFGRIGRSILRLALATDDIQVVGINDIAPLATCAYLFQYDSIFGPYPAAVTSTADTLFIGQRAIPFHNKLDISGLNLSDVDVVLECTGKADTRDVADRGLRAGAGRVLISGPSKAADHTIVLGANDADLAEQTIISNASCTTNAVAPLARLLDEAFGLISGHMTTVHCYTSSQPTIDSPRSDLARSRAAALSMVPTTTSAGRLIGDVLPHLSGRIEARAIRVPTASVSCVDLAVQLNRPATAAAVNDLFASAAQAHHIFGYITEPLVSTDLRGRPESVILSGRETSVSVGGILRVFGWYDNEWGFSSRMIDMARMMAG